MVEVFLLLCEVRMIMMGVYNMVQAFLPFISVQNMKREVV